MNGNVDRSHNGIGILSGSNAQNNNNAN